MNDTIFLSYYLIDKVAWWFYCYEEFNNLNALKLTFRYNQLGAEQFIYNLFMIRAQKQLNSNVFMR